MFENNTPPSQPQNPLNPVMPAPGMTSPQGPAPAPLPPMAPLTPQVHAMPERFRNTGPAAGGPPGSGRTKKLMITLIIVAVVAGLGVAGLFIFNNVVKSNANNANTVTNLANLNRNSNTNTAANLNVNVANTNSSTDLNLNASTNVNTNTVTNTVSNVNTTVNVNTTNTSTNTNTAVASTPLPSNTDTDSDGLTDTEELVYGTDPAVVDSDGDTYIDGRQATATGTIGEVVNLFNPKGAGTLEASALVKRVQNAVKTYGLLVPTSWTINESSGLMVVTPATTTGEFFQIRTYDNATRLTAQQWYQTNYPQVQIGSTKSVAVNGLEGIISPDGTSVYLFNDAQVYALTYTTGTLTKVNFWTTFEMMMKSFKLVAAS